MASWLRLLAGAMAGLAVVLLAMWLALPSVARWAGEAALRDAGFADARIDGVSHLGLGLRVDSIALAPAGRFALDDVQVAATLGGLVSLRAERITVGRLRLHAEVADDGSLRLPGLAPPDPARRSDGPAGLPALPVDGLAVAHATVSLVTPAGPVTAELSEIDASLTDEAIDLSARYDINAQNAALSGTLGGRVGLADLEVTIGADLTGGAASLGAAAIEHITGEAAVAVGGTRDPRATVTLTAANATVAGTDIGPLLASARLDGTAVTADVITSEPVGWHLQASATADLAAQSFDMRANVDIRDLAAAADLSLNGRAQGQLALEGGWSGGVVARGTLTLDGQDLAMPDLFWNGQATVRSALAVHPGGFDITVVDPWRLSAVPTPQALPTALEALGERPLAVSFAGDGSAGPAVVSVALSPLAVDTAGMLSIDGEAGVAVQVRMGQAQARFARASTTVETTDLTVTATSLPVADLVMEEARYTGEAIYRNGRWRLDGQGRMAATGSAGPLGLDGARAAWSGVLTGDEAGLQFVPDDCLSLRADGVRIETVRLADLTPPCLRARDDRPLVAFAFADDAVDLAARTEPAPMSLAYSVDGAERKAVRGQWPAIELDARIERGDLHALAARLEGLEAAVSADGVVLGGGQADIRFADGRLEALEARVGRVASSAAPPVWTPLEASLTARPDGEATAFEGRLGDASGALVVEIAGRSAADGGNAQVTVYPITFFPEVRELGTILPAWGETVTDSTGTLGFDGTIAWTGQGVDSAGVLTLQGIGFATPQARVTGIDAEIQFDSLLPPATPADQRVAIGMVQAGVPLTDGRIAFDLDDGRALAITQARFAVADGELGTDPFMLDLSDLDDSRVSLVGEGIALENLFAISGIEGLRGSGRLSGRIPIVVSADGVRIDAGLLDAGTQGTLTYDPDELPGFLRGDDLQTQMLRDVLKNFQYERLSLSLSGLLGTEQTVTLTSRGSNPDFLDGHPIELNVNLNGPLVNVLRSTLAPDSLPGVLEREFQLKQQETQQ